MIHRKTNAETSTLSDVRDAILSELGNTTPGTSDYEKLIDQLERISKMMKDHPKWTFTPSADTILNGALTIASILLITKHEQLNVITSKAVSFLPKLIR